MSQEGIDRILFEAQEQEENYEKCGRKGDRSAKGNRDPKQGRSQKIQTSDLKLSCLKMQILGFVMAVTVATQQAHQEKHQGQHQHGASPRAS
ncbi:hypothetical protein [Synechococcus sp. KORDI-100]|uniref:hypothetical protein n=1 Tax=Synechococcus sp. KORDI-100 TaxID=1280380 RepID=UPI0012E0199A|nr:hypothetical protein [Synechococcus sp. KORDI-100]